MTESSADRFKWRIFDGVLSLLMAVVLTLSGFMAKQVYSNSVNIAEIKGSRFTAADGLEVWKEIAGIRELIAGLPPDAFEQSMNARFDGIEKKIEENRERLVRIEAFIERKD